MVASSLHNRHYAYRHPVYTTKRAHEQDGLLVVAAPAYQTAYQSVRPGPITQVLRRTLATLCAAVQRGRILADTEEVTGSNPVSPTMKALVSDPFAALTPRLALGSVDLSPDCRPIAWRRHRRAR